MLKRNQEWLVARQRKLTQEREKKKAHETDGCTFEPRINRTKLRNDRSKYSARTNISTGSKTNRSYSDIHKNKYNKNISANSSFRTVNRSDTFQTQKSLKGDLSVQKKNTQNEMKHSHTISFEPIAQVSNYNTIDHR